MVHRRTIQQSNFDSVLHPAQANQPARLNIRLKVRLLAKDPSAAATGGPGATVFSEHLARTMAEVRSGDVLDGSNGRFRCRSWLEPEFNAFCIKFKRMVELAWNNQLVLLPPDGSKPGEDIGDAAFRELVSAPNVPAHVRCGLEIALIPFGAGRMPHAFIEAVRLERPSDHGFRSSQRLITNQDVEFSRVIDHLGYKHFQVTAAHEVGHWLGRPVSMTDEERYLPHVDSAACAAVPNHQRNDDCEYGRTLSRRMAMLGLGSLLTAHEAQPWLTRARRHTGALFGWRLMHRIDFDSGMVPLSERQKQVARTPTVAPQRVRVP